MRSKAIEIQIDITDIPTEILENYDSEFSTSKDIEILWIHDDGYKPFSRELFPYMGSVISVFNRVTNMDHLNLYQETTDDIDDYGIKTESKNYKNITWTELQKGLDPSTLLLKVEITP